MYAISFIATLRRVDAALDRALELKTFGQPERAIRIADDAVAAIDDVGELSTVALGNVQFEAYASLEGDDAVTAVLADRIDGGLSTEHDEAVLERARDTERIDEVDDDVLVPVGEGMPDRRNWWLLSGLLVDWLEELTDGFRRIHSRTKTAASNRVETAFWTVADRLEALRKSIVHARTLGQYTARSVRQGTGELLDGVGGIATAVAGGSDV